jgi:hypothetical protein
VTADVAAEFSIPKYSQASAEYWGRLCKPGADCGSVQPGNTAKTTSDLGTFTYIAWKCELTLEMAVCRLLKHADLNLITDKTGLLLNSINQASGRNSSLPQIRKLDNTGYLYHGRSYGVASAIGLIAPNQSSPARGAENGEITEFSYHEPGYQSNVKCIYNTSSALKLDKLTTWHNPGQGLWAAGFWANGSLPNGDWLGFLSWGGFDNGTVFAIAASSDKGRHIYGFVTGHYYDFGAGAGLNNLQCEANFAPDTFEVTVNVASKNISVTPSRQKVSPVDVNASGNLTDVAFFSLSYLSQVLTTGYTSVLGGAFITNIDNVRARENHTKATTSDNLVGVSEALESLLDHSLGSLGAAQLMLVGDAQTVKANATINTMQLGEPKYAYSIFGISLAIMVLLGIEAVRSRFWRTMSLFNCLDLKSAILGVVATREDKPEPLTRWDGDAADRELGTIGVTIGADKQSLVVVLKDTEGTKKNEI